MARREGFEPSTVGLEVCCAHGLRGHIRRSQAFPISLVAIISLVLLSPVLSEKARAVGRSRETQRPFSQDFETRREVVRPAGLEPATCGLGRHVSARKSIQGNGLRGHFWVRTRLTSGFQVTDKSLTSGHQVTTDPLSDPLHAASQTNGYPASGRNLVPSAEMLSK